MAANVTVPNTLTNGQPNDASQVMADLNAILTWINTNAVHLDGAKAMTGQLSSPGTDPVSANEYSRKSYVDGLIAAEVTARNAAITAAKIDPQRESVSASRVAAQSVPNNTATFITFDTENWDSDGYFAPSSTTVTIPAGRAGIYLVTYQTYGPNTAANYNELFQNGTSISIGAANGTNMAVNTLAAVGSIIVAASVGDAFTLKVLHQVGAAANITARMSLNRLSA